MAHMENVGHLMGPVFGSGGSIDVNVVGDAPEALAYARRGSGERKRPATGWDALTPTELQVTELVAHGLTTPQIAKRLLMGRATVKTHVSHCLTKLGMATRSEIAAGAARRSD